MFGGSGRGAEAEVHEVPNREGLEKEAKDIEILLEVEQTLKH